VGCRIVSVQQKQPKECCGGSSRVLLWKQQKDCCGGGSRDNRRIAAPMMALGGSDGRSCGGSAVRAAVGNCNRNEDGATVLGAVVEASA
jgi:hypothetical protein